MSIDIVDLRKIVLKGDKMELRKVVGLLLVILVILTTGLAIATSGKYNIYTDAPHVKYNEVLDDKTTPTIYYYYQDTCHFCNSIKDQVTNLYQATENNDKINLKLVDVKSADNANAWAKDESYNPDAVDMTNPENIKIKGTPSMIYVENGKVVEYESGPDVFKIMNKVNDKYNLKLTFDPSKYGKN